MENNLIHNELLINQAQSEEMKLKIQTFDNIYPISIKRSSNVGELKDKISEVKKKFNLVTQYSFNQATFNFSRKTATIDGKTITIQDRRRERYTFSRENPRRTRRIDNK